MPVFDFQEMHNLISEMHTALREHGVEFRSHLDFPDSWNCYLCNSRYDLHPGESGHDTYEKLVHKPDCLLLRSAKYQNG